MHMVKNKDKKNRVRVFINAISARRGGGQTYLINLLKFIPAEYNNIEIFLLAPDSLELVTDYPNLTRVHVKWPIENPFLRAIWEKFFLPTMLRQKDINILFCPGGVIGTKPPSGCKTITMFRNMIPFDPKVRKRYPLGYMRVRNWILEKIMSQSMLRADLVIFISEFAKKIIENYTKNAIKKAVVIPHGINPHFRNSENKTLPMPNWIPTDGYFLYVSIFDVYKAQIEVVRSFALLKQRRNTKEKLVLAGPENPDYGLKLRAEISRLGLNDDVLLVGAIPYNQLPAIYHHATINIFASECENCPNILLEALSAGRPLFSSNIAPMPEFGGDAVVYFDPGYPEQLAEKIIAVIDDSSKMEELALKSRMRSLQYQWSEAARETWKAIVDLHLEK